MGTSGKPYSISQKQCLCADGALLSKICFLNISQTVKYKDVTLEHQHCTEPDGLKKAPLMISDITEAVGVCLLLWPNSV